jgi:hypothetical protein
MEDSRTTLSGLPFVVLGWKVSSWNALIPNLRCSPAITTMAAAEKTVLAWSRCDVAARVIWITKRVGRNASVLQRQAPFVSHGDMSMGGHQALESTP